jgi:hypothetical protein
MTKKNRKLPNFKTAQSERKFWSSHSIEEFLEEREDLDVQIRPTRTEASRVR